MRNDPAHGYLESLFTASKPYRKRLIIGLIAVAVTAALDVAAPMLLKAGVDSLKSSGSVNWLYIYSGLIVLAAGIGGYFRFVMRDRVIGASRYVESDLREGYLQHLLSLSPSFFDHRHTGDLMARATEDIERVRMVLGPALLYSLNTVLIIGFSAAMMFALDTTLALLVLGLAPIIGITVFTVSRILHRANLHQQETYGELTSHVQENLTGIRVIKAFVREETESRKFRSVCDTYLKRSLDVARAQSLFMPLLGMLIGLGTAGILYVGGYRIVAGTLTLGEFIAFMGYLSLMTWPMIALGWVTHLYQRGSASFKRLDDIMSENPQFGDVHLFNSDGIDADLSDTSNPIDAPEIEFRDINLRYRATDDLILKGISLVIPSGSTLAIVGQVGSGKSSLVRVLSRLYIPESGLVMVDGQPWDQMKVTELRRMIGYVDQSPFLFSSSIRSNITLSLPDASDEQVKAAAKEACFDSEIDEFPDGYDTLIGERGVTLSGGQQQRLTLARALLMNPPILILDDSLSAVDADTEMEILANLSKRHEGRTTLFVTHRLAAAERANLVAVMHRGSIVELGSHEKLLKTGGLYFAMHKRQRLADELGSML